MNAQNTEIELAYNFNFISKCLTDFTDFTAWSTVSATYSEAVSGTPKHKMLISKFFEAAKNTNQVIISGL